MKRILCVWMILVSLVVLAGCGEDSGEGGIVAGGPEKVMATDVITIDAIVVDDDYRDSQSDSLRMVYLAYTLNAADQNLSADSKYTDLTIEDTNKYTCELYSAVNGAWMPNLYYSAYIEDVYIGSTLKVLATFKIPEADLAAGRKITLADTSIPTIEELTFTTDEIQHCSGAEAAAALLDPAGYAEVQAQREPADEATTQNVQNQINGYYFSFYVNRMSYELEFMAPNSFEIRSGINGSGMSNTGIYSVRKGYIFLSYDGGATYAVEIPYGFENGEITLNCVDAFDVNK